MKDGMDDGRAMVKRPRQGSAAAGSPARRSLAVGGVCAPAGCAVGFSADRLAAPGTPYVMWFYGALAAFLTGWLLWRALAATRPGVVRGAVAGAFTGVLAPAVCSVILSVAARVQDVLAGAPVGPGAAVQGFFLAVLMGLLSLYYAGWVTVPLGAAIGAVAGALQKRRALPSLPDRSARPGGAPDTTPPRRPG